MNNRKPTRLTEYDYSKNGAYVITICTKDKAKILSDVCRGGVLLRPLGNIVENELLDLEKRYNVIIDKYCIMPNHIHLIIFINGLNREEQSPSPTISDIICTFKSITTKKINLFEKVKARQIWQRSFFDHIIRNEQDLFNERRHIEENPIKWLTGDYRIM